MRLARTLAVALLCASPAFAAIYENTITAEDEDDLFTAQQRGDISDATADTLLELIREGVDLNSANREELYDLPGLTYEDCDAILEYRKLKGRIEDPSELVGANAITPEQLLQLAPFIRIDAARPRLPIGGKVRLVSQYTATDGIAPPALLSARLKGPWDLSAGFMLVGARRTASRPISITPIRPDGLPSDEPRESELQTTIQPYALQLPRAFLQWHSGKRKLIAGTYTIGFGERLTLDNTRRVTPRGIYLTDDFRRPTDLTSACRDTGDCPELPPDLRVTPNYASREVFRGVAGSIEDLKVGSEATLSMYGFLSYQTRSLFQYELYDRRGYGGTPCTDPSSEEVGCKAPLIVVGPDNQNRLRTSTLIGLFDELAGGGHVAFKPNYRITLGATAFAALPIFHQQPVELDFQEWSRYPNGGAFGAVGLNAQASWRQFNFHLEAARSFDRAVNGGGGFGVVQRSVWSQKKQEVELVFRYYDAHFGTPYARPVSSPDETDGLRARNELGARLRYLHRPNKDWELRGRADFWVNPHGEPLKGLPAGIPNLYALARVDFNGWSFFQPAVWVDVRNRNLAVTNRGECTAYGEGQLVPLDGTPPDGTSPDGTSPERLSDSACRDLYRVALRIDSVILGKYLRATAQGWLTWVDDTDYPDRFRNDVLLWGELKSQPTDFLQLRLRTRYVRYDLTPDLAPDEQMEQTLWTFLEAAWLPMKGTRLSLRYDVFVWLDQRSPTLKRYPNPEHRFMLDLRTTF